jgi:hypothetical protein
MFPNHKQRNCNAQPQHTNHVGSDHHDPDAVAAEADRRHVEYPISISDLGFMVMLKSPSMIQMRTTPGYMVAGIFMNKTSLIQLKKCVMS